MPLYFFNLENHVRDIDDEGTELANDDVARRQAVMFAGNHLSENPDLPWDGKRMKVEVTDEAGAVLLNVVVTTEDPQQPNA